MSQGKKWNKKKVTGVLRPYFKLGCSVTKACQYAGIPQSTVDDWIQNDEVLRLKITAWQNEIRAKARKKWSGAINSGDVDKAITWLERKEKDEFMKSEGREHTEKLDDEDFEQMKEEIITELKDVRKRKKPTPKK